MTIDALSIPPLDASGLDIEQALRSISEALIQASLPFTVKESAHLMIARFSTYGMWKDLRNHWETMMRAPVFRHLTERAGHDFRQPEGREPIQTLKVDESTLPLPIPADGAQMRAVKAAAEGYSFVLEGPPGTGKSQTITNLIAHSLDKGKKILFVAEKQAALEVVKRRLDEIGLGPFTLNLHGGEQSPRRIKDQLKESIDAEVFYDFNAWDTAVTNLRSRLAPLLEYPAKIHDSNGAGYSLWSAASALSLSDDGPTAQITETFVADPPMPVDEIRAAVRDLGPQARITDFSSVPRWSLAGEVDEARFLPAWQQLERVRVQIADSPVLRDFIGRNNVGEQLAAAATAEEIPPAGRLDPQQRDDVKTTVLRLEALREQVVQLHHSVGELGALFPVEFIQAADVQPILKAITEVRSARFRRKKRLEDYQRVLAPMLRQDIGPVDIEGEHAPERIEALLMRLPQLRQVGASLRQALDAVPMTEPLLGRSALDPALPQAIEQHAAELERLATTAELNAPALHVLQDLDSAGIDKRARSLIGEAFAAWDEWCAAIGATDSAIDDWAAGRSVMEAWFAEAAAWTADIHEHGSGTARRVFQWSRAAEPLRAAGLNAFLQQIESGDIAPHELEMAFQRGLEVASVAERSARSLLRDFHAEIKSNELDQLVRAMERVRKEIRLALPARLLKRRPYEPGNLDGRTATLRRLLDAKRNAMSFRSLLLEYGEEILTLAPCFFVSPASLATFVEPGAVDFDIVVFDEASQITVDQAMGALGRGKSAVIVGDSKQMPPTRIGKTNLESADYPDEPSVEADEMANIDDLESILSEAVESGLPQLWLSWHYRSKDESLISFSNAHYYQGKLASLPSPGNIPGAGVRVRRLDGEFIRDSKVGRNENGTALFRTNPVEASAIVDTVVHRLNDPLTQSESIGIVTFNIQQRDLILDLLDQSTDPLVRKRLEPGPDGIFVKNLENVQGDERDVILFSTAFSKPKDGSPMPLNFGPLNNKGGERRLNVAVTRARKEVELFCSFDPQDIDLKRTKSVGLAHLRDYIEDGLANADGLSSEAALGSSAVAGDTQGRRSLNINEMRDDIARRLRERGWVVATDYGRSSYTLDMVVRPEDAETWHAAILTDGEKWSALPTVADRDITPTLLEKLMEWGGAIRVWLPEWLADPEALLRRIENELHAAGERVREQEKRRAWALAEAAAALEKEREELAEQQEAEDAGETAATTDLGASGADPELDSSAEDGVQWTEIGDDSTESEQSVDIMSVTYDDSEPVLVARESSADRAISAQNNSPLPTERPYVELSTDKLGDVEELEAGFLPSHRAELRKMVLAELEEAGPVRLSVLRLSLAKRFGRQRTSNVVNQHLDQLIPADHIKQERSGDMVFVWPTRDGASAWPFYRASTGRNLDEIPLEEIGNVIRVLTDQTPDLLAPDPDTRERLARKILEFFNLRRLTTPARKRINDAVDALV